MLMLSRYGVMLRVYERVVNARYDARCEAVDAARAAAMRDTPLLILRL